MCLSYANVYFTDPPLRLGAKAKYWKSCMYGKRVMKDERYDRRAIELQRKDWKLLARKIAAEYLDLHIAESEVSSSSAGSPVESDPESLTQSSEIHVVG